MAGDADLLIHSKLRGPLLRPQLVARPRLVARVQNGLRGPLTLIAAPAGFGKTTLAAGALDALAARGRKAAWLSLEGADSEIGRFLAYLLAALQTVSPGLGRSASELLAGPQLPTPTLLLASLVNDLEQDGAVDGAVVLVLDDYHVIHSPAVHEAVTFLLDHAAHVLHLLITTRADPPLPLARLRARGHLVEVRGADLRFTLQESAAFLEAATGRRLADELVALLDQRTEGWAAGLQLAALRLAGDGGPGLVDQPGAVEAFVRRFSGTQRYVLDYLIEEVLDHQGAAMQRFLLLISPLERLCGPLCDALLDAVGEEDARQARPSAGSLLEELARANVFLTALDDEHRWHRFHPLFADLLRARLRERYPGLERQLRAAAADWLEANGCVAEAVAQALAASDEERAARLVEQHTVGLLARGELASLLSSIAALPQALRDRRPLLCLQQAYALAFAGHLDAAGEALDRAEEAVAGAVTGLAGRAQAGARGAVRAMLAVMAGREEEAVDLAQKALALLPAEAHWDRAAAYWALGYARRGLGDLAGAQACFAEQIRLARVMGNVWTLMTGLADLALVLRTQGHLQQAGDLLAEALDAAGSQGARSHGYIARMESALAAILYERNDLAAALHLLDSAVAHLRHWPNPNHVAYAYLLLARVKRAQGGVAAAGAALQTALQARKRGPLTRVLRCSVEAEVVRTRFFYAAGDEALLDDELAGEAERLAAQWREEAACAGMAGAPALRWDETTEITVLALGYASLDAATPELLALLGRVAANAAQAQRVGMQIEALVLLTMAQPQQEGRYVALEEALALAGTRGYVRVFVDAGPRMQRLIGQWLNQPASRIGHPWRACALRLLAALEAEAGMRQTAPAPAAPEGRLGPPSAAGLGGAAGPGDASPLVEPLVEPLSIREREVLALLAQGLSNRQIADLLVVAPGTIKAHTAAIYRKLDVANRTEAAACARRLGLL